VLQKASFSPLLEGPYNNGEGGHATTYNGVRRKRIAA
jgi:hypothetical protein